MPLCATPCYNYNFYKELLTRFHMSKYKKALSAKTIKYKNRQ